MTTIVIDSTDKVKAGPEALLEYSREIAPMLRDLLKQKELLADFIESDEKAIELKEDVSEAQQVLKNYLEEEEYSKGLYERIKEIENDVKLAVKAAARVCDFKPAELKQFFLARIKETVDKTVDKGITFSTLEELLK